MPTDVSQIQETAWQVALNAPGEVVTGLAEIEQAVYIVITTERGSDPLRPEFGITILASLDRPASLAIPRMKREIYEGLAIWETRVTVKKVTHTLDNGQLTFVVEWETAAGEQGVTEVTYRYGVA